MVSLILPTFKRANLLNLGLFSINQQKIDYSLEILVLNDGIHDDTEEVCKKYSNLNIRYIFTGQRNLDGQVKSRIPGFAINIGVKQCSGDIIVLSCPEIWHINNCLNFLIPPLLKNNKLLTIPNIMYFDNRGLFTEHLKNNKKDFSHLYHTLTSGRVAYEGVTMPFLMGMWKKEYIDIGGYDEEFIKYASDDNDFCDRLIWNELSYLRTPAKIIHLFHGKVIDGQAQPNNPDWVYNHNLRMSKQGIIKRNTEKEWGIL